MNWVNLLGIAMIYIAVAHYLNTKSNRSTMFRMLAHVVGMQPVLRMMAFIDQILASLAAARHAVATAVRNSSPVAAKALDATSMLWDRAFGALNELRVAFGSEARARREAEVVATKEEHSGSEDSVGEYEETGEADEEDKVELGEEAEVALSQASAVLQLPSRAALMPSSEAAPQADNDPDAVALGASLQKAATAAATAADWIASSRPGNIEETSLGKHIAAVQAQRETPNVKENSGMTLRNPCKQNERQGQPPTSVATRDVRKDGNALQCGSGPHFARAPSDMLDDETDTVVGRRMDARFEQMSRAVMLDQQELRKRAELVYSMSGGDATMQVDVLHAGEHIQLILPTKGIMEESQLVVKIRDLLITRPTTKVVGVLKQDLRTWMDGLEFRYFDPYNMETTFPRRGKFADLSMWVSRAEVRHKSEPTAEFPCPRANYKDWDDSAFSAVMPVDSIRNACADDDSRTEVSAFSRVLRSARTKQDRARTGATETWDDLP